jgi:hypothetical protein
MVSVFFSVDPPGFQVKPVSTGWSLEVVTHLSQQDHFSSPLIFPCRFDLNPCFSS